MILSIEDCMPLSLERKEILSGKAKMSVC